MDYWLRIVDRIFRFASGHARERELKESRCTGLFRYIQLIMEASYRIKNLVLNMV
jgi:hypothetical protein